MRALVALALCAGCGRIEFEPLSDALLCPPGYTRDTGSCYRTGAGTATWLEAEAACEADGRGAHLAAVEDAAELAVVVRYLPSPTDFAWIGSTDLLAEGTYRTVTNRGAATPFASGEPDGDLQDCVVIRDATSVGDGTCANADDYICEYDGIPAVSLAWGVCPPGYTQAGEGCYRFVGSAGAGTSDWRASEAACEDDGIGAHLVVLGDAAEATLVASLAAPILDWYVGATDLRAEGVFVSVTNAPLAFAGWDVGEPDGGTTQNCVQMSRNATIKSVDCADADDFMCEYDGVAAVPAAWAP